MDGGIHMKVALLSLALLGGQSVVPISDRLPNLNVEALCKETSAVDKAMDLAEAQSAADCMRDEGAAQQQLSVIWDTTPGSLRDRCEAEATIGGVASYVDLLTCVQMANMAGSPSSPTPLRRASKNRNSK
jgi:hypothetical protein